MRYRILALFVTAFFLVMNGLLCWTEFFGRSRFGSPVPAEVVWEKVLTSPDISLLEIRQHGTAIGRATWVATVGEHGQPALPGDPGPEGMIKRVGSYNLDLDGTVFPQESTRLRFALTLKLDTNQHWQEFSFKVGFKPYQWELAASAGTERLHLIIEDEEGRRELTYTFAELREPEKLLRSLGVPALPLMLGGLGFSGPSSGAGSPGLALAWEARNDWLRIGHNQARVYRLEARLLDRYKAVLFVSRVGEILRLELPGEIVLANDPLNAF